jgi:hypothetical protein
MTAGMTVPPHDEGLDTVDAGGPPGAGTIRELDAHRPGLRAAFQARMELVPEYRSWLQQFGPGVLAAVDELAGVRPASFPGGHKG